MIEETKKKIHFVAFVPGQEIKEKPITAIVSTKNNGITIGAKAIKEMGMAGKFVRFYYDAGKKIVGWQMRDSVEQSEMDLWKLCQPNTSGTWTAGIGKILRTMSLKEETSYPALEIKKYRENGKLENHSGKTFYFVEVKEEPKIEVTLMTEEEKENKKPETPDPVPTTA